MLFLWEEFLLHIPCCLNVYTGSFSYTSRAVLISTLGVSLIHPMQVFSFFIWWTSLTDTVLVSFFFLFFSFFLFIKGVCHTHPVLAWFLSGVFLLHIPCWFHFYRGSFSYTSGAGFGFIWGETHPEKHIVFIWGEIHPALASFLCGVFL